MLLFSCSAATMDTISSKSDIWVNRFVVLNEEGEVLRDSSAYADFQITNKDTFEIGEQIELKFKIYDPLYQKHDSTGLIIRDFELPYFGYIPNAESKEYSLDSNLAINISLEAEGNIGKNYITGMLFEQDAVTKTYHSYYFYIPYYIK